VVTVIGYPATQINYCPRCGSTNIEYSEHWNSSDGILTCECGCSVYIVASDMDG
jgi:hypothetical protein